MTAARAALFAVVTSGTSWASCGPVPSSLRGEPMRIDGTFDDWEDVPPLTSLVTNSSDAGPVRVSSLRATADSASVYLAIALDRVANVQGLPGAILLVVDADGDATTGARRFDVDGADLVISLTRLTRSSEEGRSRVEPRHGVAVWSAPATRADETTAPADAGDPYSIGLAFEPRHTARRIELRLAKGGAIPGGGLAFTGGAARMGVVVADSTGQPVQRVAPVILPLEPRRPVPTPDPRGVARSPEADFRLVSWNVARDRSGETPDPFRRILRALDPDVVALGEVSPDAEASLLRSLLPDRRGVAGGWEIHRGTSGSGQRGLFAIRGSLAAAEAFRNVAYPDSVGRRLGEPAAADLDEVRAGLEGAGVPATGAWLETPGGELLLVSVDLVCCGNSRESPEDWIRRIEAEAIHRAARAELDARLASGAAPPGVLVVGDFNLVGGREPLDTAASGLDPAGGDLRAAPALQLDGGTSATWTNGEGPFPPGQLDYVLYAPSKLRVIRAFVFETADLAPEERARLGLESGDSDLASDHRPVVVDFAWR